MGDGIVLPEYCFQVMLPFANNDRRRTIFVVPDAFANEADIEHFACGQQGFKEEIPVIQFF